MSLKTGSLPYSINANGIYTSSSNGNTPINYSTNQSNSSSLGTSQKISDWWSYLATTFGAGINPNINGGISNLYSFNIITNLRNDIKCSSGSIFRSFSAKIVGVNGNQLDVMVDNINSK